eukprot:scaffold92896_cov30-Tisochrysis_lutea.AAC.2
MEWAPAPRTTSGLIFILLLLNLLLLLEVGINGGLVPLHSEAHPTPPLTDTSLWGDGGLTKGYFIVVARVGLGGVGELAWAPLI